MDGYELAKIAAEALDYRDAIKLSRWEIRFYPRPRVNKKKDTADAYIASMPRSIAISQPNYVVTVYVDPLARPSCSILGTVDSPILDRVLDAWDNPDIRAVVQEKVQWLQDNPMYRQPVVSRTVAKSRLDPKQLETPRSTR